MQETTKVLVSGMQRFLPIESHRGAQRPQQNEQYMRGLSYFGSANLSGKRPYSRCEIGMSSDREGQAGPDIRYGYSVYRTRVSKSSS